MGLLRFNVRWLALGALIAVPVIAGGVAAWLALLADLGTAAAAVFGATTGAAVGLGLRVSRRADGRRAFPPIDGVGPIDLEGSVRLFWEASRDFLTAGWGRNDLETLRLICLNLEPGQLLGPRVADRLRAAVSAVRGGVTERLTAIAECGRAIGLDGPMVARLEQSIATIDEELEDASCRSGEPLVFAPARVANAAAMAVESCDALRERLRPRIVSDPASTLRRISHTALAARIASGELLFDLSAVTDSCRVAVRTHDLERSFRSVFERIFQRSMVVGPVRCTATREDRLVRITIGWRVEDRDHLDPAHLVEPLRVLTSYGGRLAVQETPEDAGIELLVWLPDVVATGPATGASARTGA